MQCNDICMTLLLLFSQIIQLIINQIFAKILGPHLVLLSFISTQVSNTVKSR